MDIAFKIPAEPGWVAIEAFLTDPKGDRTKFKLREVPIHSWVCVDPSVSDFPFGGGLSVLPADESGRVISEAQKILSPETLKKEGEQTLNAIRESIKKQGLVEDV